MCVLMVLGERRRGVVVAAFGRRQRSILDAIWTVHTLFLAFE